MGKKQKMMERAMRKFGRESRPLDTEPRKVTSACCQIPIGLYTQAREGREKSVAVKRQSLMWEVSGGLG